MGAPHWVSNLGGYYSGFPMYECRGRDLCMGHVSTCKSGCGCESLFGEAVLSPATQAAPRGVALPQARCLQCEHLCTGHADCNQCKEQHSSLQVSSWDADKHWIQPSSPDFLTNSKYQKEYRLKSFCQLVPERQSSSRVLPEQVTQRILVQWFVPSRDFSQHTSTTCLKECAIFWEEPI